MRGKGVIENASTASAGITPAYAGKRETARTWEDLSTDHPRLCGEKFMRLFPCLTRLGSPPPMRGKGVLFSTLYFRIRITPAYAGKSTSFRQLLYSCQDHPRLCGEKLLVSVKKSVMQGSPPPMRGKGASWKCLIDCKGITPAYAGKSVVQNFFVPFRQDHPRLCGEKSNFHKFPV